MSNWRKIENLLIYSGKGITPKYVNESSIIVLNQKCIRNHKINYSLSRFTDDTKIIKPEKFIQKGDILFNSTGQGTAGRCAFVDCLPENKKVITDSHILVLRMENYFEAKCLSYSFNSIEKDIMSFMDGSTGQGELDKIRVFNLLTSLTENPITQKQIAKVLSDLDAKIEVNNKINQELEAMAKTLYDYWFVQFDFPDATGKPYKSSGGKMVYNEELKREIPEGWEVKKLKEIAKTGSGGTPLKSKKEYYEQGNIPWINSGEVNDSFIISAKKYISELGLEKSSAKLFNKGTILMAMYGATAGQVSLIDIEACTNQAICGINPFKEELKFYTKFSLEDMYKYLLNLSTGSARDNLSQDKIKELYIVIPENVLIAEFHEKIKSNFNTILLNLKQNQKLSELRDWLLPMLMNGQVTVNAAEEALGMVAEAKANYNGK